MMNDTKWNELSIQQQEELENMLHNDKIKEKLWDEVDDILYPKFKDCNNFGAIGDEGGFSYDFQPNETMGNYHVTLQVGVGYIFVASVDYRYLDDDNDKKRYPDKKEYEYTSKEEFEKKIKTAIAYLKRLEKKYSN